MSLSVSLSVKIGTRFLSLGTAIGGAEVEVALQDTAVIRRHRLRAVVCSVGHRQKLVLLVGFGGRILDRLRLGRSLGFGIVLVLRLLVVVLLGGFVVRRRRRRTDEVEDRQRESRRRRRRVRRHDRRHVHERRRCRRVDSVDVDDINSVERE